MNVNSVTSEVSKAAATYDFLDEKMKERFSKNKKAGIKLHKWSRLIDKTNGLRKGLHLIVAKAHAGKSTFMVDLANDLLNNNADIKVLYYSVDDSKDEAIIYFIANKAGLRKEAVDYLENISKIEEEKIKEAYEFYKEKARNGLFLIQDVTDIYTVDLLEQDVKAHAIPDKTVIFIDGGADLDIEGNDIRIKHVNKAIRLKKMATENKIPVIASMEVTKLKGILRPTKEDIAESGKYHFAASSIICLSPIDEKQFSDESRAQGVIPKIVFEMQKNKFCGLTVGNIYADLKGNISTFDIYPRGSMGEDEANKKKIEYDANFERREKKEVKKWK